MSERLFVYVKEDVRLSPDTLLEKDDVGIIRHPTGGDLEKIFFVYLWKEIELSSKHFEIFDVSQTGDAFDDKVCNICHKLLPTSSFARNQNGVNNRPVRRPSCQDCRKLLEGKEATAEEKRKWAKSRPDKEPFECPICGKRTIAGVTCKVVLDHSHHTGKIRGWVCDSCNTGIGRFKDDIELLKNAIKHLE